MSVVGDVENFPSISKRLLPKALAWLVVDISDSVSAICLIVSGNEPK